MSDVFYCGWILLPWKKEANTPHPNNKRKGTAMADGIAKKEVVVVAVVCAVVVYYATRWTGYGVALGIVTILCVIWGPSLVRGLREGFRQGRS